MSISKVLLLGAAACFLTAVFKDRNDIARIITISAALAALLFAFSKFDVLYKFAERLRDQTWIGSRYADIVYKVIGISLIGEVVSSICADHQNRTLKTSLEIACKCAVIVLALPIFSDVLNSIGELLK